jgi:hypothetical protein
MWPAMKHHAPIPHPGPFRIPRVDAEVAGILVAIGFVVMGVVAIPIVKWFLLGAIALGATMAVIRRMI